MNADVESGSLDGKSSNPGVLESEQQLALVQQQQLAWGGNDPSATADLESQVLETGHQEHDATPSVPPEHSHAMFQTEAVIDQADAEVAHAEKELVPMAKGSKNAVLEKSMSKAAASVKLPAKELAPTTPSKAADGISGSVPDIKKQAEDLIQSVSGRLHSPVSFLETSARHRHH